MHLIILFKIYTFINIGDFLYCFSKRKYKKVLWSECLQCGFIVNAFNGVYPTNTFDSDVVDQDTVVIN
ncbi:spore germination protein (plasmid) [Bacillus sp. JAS24-2]|nr:spore germination protein [Bacillus sp. JAS24-2]